MIRCYRDAKGYCRADANDLHRLIPCFLEDDVQGSVATCQELIDIVDAVRSGRLGEWEGTGNAHTVTITPGQVTIRCEFSDEFGIAHIPPAVFRECLEAWMACITS